MVLLRKTITYFFSLVILFCLYLFLIFHEFIAYWLACLLIALCLMHFLVIGTKQAPKNALIFFLLSLFFLISSVSFLTLLENYNLKIFLIFLITLILFFYWQLLIIFFHWPSEYQPFSLTEFGHYILIISWFFLTTTAFAWAVFLDIVIWLVALFLTLFFVAVEAWGLWLHQKTQEHYGRFFLISIILFFQFTIILTILPVSYFAKGFIMTVLAYLWLTLTTNDTVDKREQRNFVKKIIFSLIIVLIILATGRWF